MTRDLGQRALWLCILPQGAEEQGAVVKVEDYRLQPRVCWGRRRPEVRRGSSPLARVKQSPVFKKALGRPSSLSPQPAPRWLLCGRWKPGSRGAWTAGHSHRAAGQLQLTVCLPRFAYTYCLAFFFLPSGFNSVPKFTSSVTSASAPPLLGTAFCLSGSVASPGVCDDNSTRAYITLLFLQVLRRQSLMSLGAAVRQGE